MSWVTDFKRRVSLTLQRNPVENQTQSTELTTSPLSTPPLDGVTFRFPINSKVERLNELIKIITNPSETSSNETTIRQTIEYFEVAVSSQTDSLLTEEYLKQIDSLPEFSFATSQFIASKLQYLIDNSELAPEDIKICTSGLAIIRILVEFQKNLAKAISHTNLPKSLIYYKKTFSEKFNRNVILKTETTLEMNQDKELSFDNFHQTIVITWGFLLLNDYFVKDLVLKGLAKDLFEDFISCPDESTAELVGCATRNAADRCNGLDIYLTSKEFFITCCVNLKRYLERKTLSSDVSFIRIVSLFNQTMEEFTDKSWYISQNFATEGGYTLVVEFLLLPPFDGKYLDSKARILSILENLVFAGPEKTKQELLDSLGILDLEVGLRTSSGPCIRNFLALSTIMFVLLYPKIDDDFNLSSSTLNKTKENPLPDHYRVKFLRAIVNLASISHLNYLLIASFSPILIMLEKFSTSSFQIQEILLKFLITSVQRFDYSPVKELGLLPYVLEESSDNPDSLQLIYNSIAELTQHSLISKDTIREVGILGAIIDNFTKVLNLAKSIIKKDQKLDASFILTSNEKDFTSEISEIRKFGFTGLCFALGSIISNNQENIRLFKKKFSTLPLEFLFLTSTRGGFLSLLKDLLESEIDTEQNPSDREIRFSKSYIVRQIINFLEQVEEYSILSDIFTLLRSFLSRAPVSQIMFVKAGGISSLFSTLSKIRFGANYSESKFTNSLFEPLEIMQELLLTLLSSLLNNHYTQWYLVECIGLGAFEEALALTEIFSHNNLIIYAFSMLFGLTTGKETLIQSPARTWVELTSSKLLFGYIECSCFIPTIFSLSKFILDDIASQNQLLDCLWKIMSASTYNQILFSQQQVARKLLTWNNSQFLQDSYNSDISIAILYHLLEFGANDLRVSALLDNSILFNSVDYELNLTDKLEVLQAGVERGITPPIFHFDSNCFHPTIRLTSTPRQLWTGHSILLWVQFIHLPDDHEFSIFCFGENSTYKLSIRKDQRLTLYGPNHLTIIFNNRPFCEETWYHIALVHSKALISLTGGNVSLYINGDLVEHRRHSIANEPDSRVYNLGNVDGLLSSAVWNLSAFSILSEAIESNTVKAISQMGATYTGSFQDPSLLYERSNYTGYQETDPKLESNWISRGTLVLNLKPQFTTMVLDQEDSRFGQRCIPNSKHTCPGTGNNAIDDIAWVSDSVLVSKGINMAMDLWRAGGCTLLLKLIEQAKSSSELEKAVCLLISTLRYRRFKKEMIQIRGYEILGFLLKQKVSIVTPLLIRILLSLSVSERSLKIIHPAALQYIILDFEIWKSASLDTQTAILEVLLELSSFQDNNNWEILNGLSAVKRLLYVLRYDIFQKDLLTKIVRVLRCLLVSTYTQENIRLIVAFITSMLARDGHNKELKLGSTSSRLDKSSIINDAREYVCLSYHLVVGNEVLEMLHDLLQDDDHSAKMATMITSKWLILLFNTDNNPYAIVLALRILSRLFLLGPAFVNKFCSHHEGFVVLGWILPKWWFLAQLYPALFSIMLNVRIETISLNSGIDFFSLVSLASHGLNPNRELSMESCLIFFRLIKNCLSSYHFDKELNESETSEKAMARSRSISVSEKFDEKSSPRSSYSNEDFLKVARISRMVQSLLQFSTELYHKCKLSRQLFSHQAILDIIAATMFALSENFKCTPSQFDRNFSERAQSSSYHSGAYASSEIKYSTTFSSLQSHRRSMTMPEPATPAANSLTTTSTVKGEAIESFIEFTLTLCTFSVFGLSFNSSKPLSVIESLLKAPFDGSFERYMRYTNFFFTHLLHHIKSSFQLDPTAAKDTKALLWTVKLSQLCVDACYQGFFTSGRLLIFDFIVSLLDIIFDSRNQPLEARMENSISALRKELNRIILYCFTESTSTFVEPRFTIQFLKNILFQHVHIFSPKNTDLSFWKNACFHLFELLQYEFRNIRIIAFNIWKLLVLMKGPELSLVLKCKDTYHQSIMDSFRENLDMDLESFSTWFDSSVYQVKLAFSEFIKPHWDENKREEMASVYNAVSETRAIFSSRKEQQRSYQEEELKSFRRVMTNTVVWARKLQSLETDGYLRLVQDQVDNSTMVTMLWKKALSRSSNFAEANRRKNHWKLDLTEDSFRMRRRLKPDRHMRSDFTPNLKHSRTVKSPSPDTKKGISLCYTKSISYQDDFLVLDFEPDQVKADLEESAYQFEEAELQSDIPEADSKVHRVLRYMEASEEVLEVFNVGRVTGLEVTDALLMFCTFNIYVIDGYFLCSDGTIVETSEIPDDEKDTYLQLLAVATKQKPTKSSLHQCRKCAYNDLKEIHKRKFLFRNSALEVFFSDGRNLLITTLLVQRDTVYQKFTQKLVSTVDKTNVDTTLGARLTTMFFGSSSLTELTQRWEHREITNFEYLMHLNAFAGRSYNDLTQYPVFPWILSDYTSEILDLKDPSVFRDLSKPMGAQSEGRALEFSNRYSNFIDDDQPPFHYGTHYSSAMIVCWYLIRLEPFTTHHLQLQGGYFDHPDRLFFSVKEAWLSAAFQNTTDVRELIPEFFYLPEFLENHNNIDFGLRQDKEVIDAVYLPPWALGSPELFIRKHREALESEFVSSHLHEWIDLIFGYKQQGPEAVKALNVYHHLSYQDAVDLDTISDPVEKQATVGIINNFGQTPLQLFKKPHPKRNAATPPRCFDIARDVSFLVKSNRPLLDVEMSVHEIKLANDRLLALGGTRVFIPRKNHRQQLLYMEWGLIDNSVRLFQSDNNKLVGTYEECHFGRITDVKAYDSTIIITGADDSLVKVWELKMIRSSPRLSLRSIFRGSDAPITVICTCSNFGIAAIGTSRSKIYLWDIPRAKFIRSMTISSDNILLIAISRSSGSILACTQNTIASWTLNGLPIASLTLPISSPAITSCTFIEPAEGEYFSHDLILTGHQGGILQLWKLSPVRHESDDSRGRSFTLINTIADSFDIASHHLEDILSIHVSPSRQVLFCGTRKGTVHSWQFPDTLSELHWMKDSTTCCICGDTIIFSDRKSFCSPCGGLICDLCSCDSPFFDSDQSPLKQCRSCLQRYCQASKA